MLTFFSFLIVLFGSFNWFFIAAFQYDIVAGFFGTQASLFSRFVYFIIGIAAFVLLVMAFKNKGNIKITENSFKKSKQKPKETSPLPVEEVPAPINQIESPLAPPQQETFKDFDITKYDE